MARNGLNIYKRKDGRWEGRYKNGFTADGKTKYSSVYDKSYYAVKEKLNQKRSEALRCADTHCTLTAGEVIQNWLADKKNKVKESTLANYEMKLKRHILPCFAGIKFDKLTADCLSEFINKKIGEQLSPKYVSDIVMVVKTVARFAQRRYNYPNRFESVTMPRLSNKSERKTLNSAEINKLKSIITENPTNSNIGVLLAASTGIRIGELCALKWTDIDLEKSILTVRQTVQRIMKSGGGTKLVITAPKSESSVREIPLPDFILPFLKKIQGDKNAYLLSGNEKIIEPRAMQFRFKNLLKAAKLPYVNFHSLRHSFATSCVALGVDVKTLSEILGHSSVRVTLNLYVHSSMERKKSCMKIFSDSFAA